MTGVLRMRGAGAAMAAAVAVAVMVLVPTGVASAAWSLSGSGRSGAGATTMPTGNAPTGVDSGSSVRVSWTAADMGSGTPVAGYVVNRYNAINGSPGTVVSACAGVVTGTSCIENPVPSGTWVYTVTPVQGGWTGGESSASGAVTVP